MVTLANGGAWLVNGAEIIADGPKAQAELAAKTGRTVSKEEAKKQTIAYGILENHNTSGIGVDEVPDSLCSDQLPQLPVCGGRNDQ